MGQEPGAGPDGSTQLGPGLPGTSPGALRGSARASPSSGDWHFTAWAGIKRPWSFCAWKRRGRRQSRRHSSGVCWKRAAGSPAITGGRTNMPPSCAHQGSPEAPHSGLHNCVPSLPGLASPGDSLYNKQVKYLEWRQGASVYDGGEHCHLDPRRLRWNTRPWRRCFVKT